MNAAIAARFQELLQLRSAPVAVSFVDEIPAGLERGGGEPAGCGYWRRAAEGEVFYTEPEDHLRCPIGAHTHGVDMPEGAKTELNGMLKMMVELGYLRMDEVPGIPHRLEPLRYAVYGPYGRTPVPADAVLFRGPARQMMLLAEAASAAGVAGEMPAMGRPTCAVLPAAIGSGKTAASFGCAGNRIYTAARDEDAYFAVPGSALDAVAEKLAVIAKANIALEAFHRSRVN